MNVGTVLDFDRIIVVVDQSPELALDVMLGQSVFVFVEWGVLSRKVGKVILLEFVRFAQEARKRIHIAIFESILVVANHTAWTDPAVAR